MNLFVCVCLKSIKTVGVFSKIEMNSERNINSHVSQHIKHLLLYVVSTKSRKHTLEMYFQVRKSFPQLSLVCMEGAALSQFCVLQKLLIKKY